MVAKHGVPICHGDNVIIDTGIEVKLIHGMQPISPDCIDTRNRRRRDRLSPARFAASIAATLWTWSERARQRNTLAQLNDRMLRDIGLNRADAWREWHKPWWRE